MPIVTLAVAAGIIGTVLWRVDRGAPRERIGFQDADKPLDMPQSGTPDHRFFLPSAWQVFRIPQALRFDLPLGSEHGALTHRSQAFGAVAVPGGGLHLGDDLRGIGGGDTSLGDPVFAVADGLVLFAGEPSSEWGKVAVVAHRSADGRHLHSMYAHLDQLHVAVGSLIPRGGRLGTVGTANGHHPAHLHFELRSSHGVDIGSLSAEQPLNRLDPSATLATLRGAKDEELSPSPLAKLLKPESDPWTEIEIQGAGNFPGIPTE
jgi:murein DD-endopeptidase MepM/ murein hydrolase activator NlpD